jgi:hypothetical protein
MDLLHLSQDLDLLTLSMQIVKVQVLTGTPHVTQSTSERDSRLLEPISLVDLAFDAPFLNKRGYRLADVELVRVRVGVLRCSESLDSLSSESKVLSRVEFLFLNLGLLLLLLGLLSLSLGLLSLGSLLLSLLLTLLELTFGWKVGFSERCQLIQMVNARNSAYELTTWRSSPQ